VEPAPARLYGEPRRLLEADEVRARIAYSLKSVFERFDVVIRPVDAGGRLPPQPQALHRPQALPLFGQPADPLRLNAELIALATACGLPVDHHPRRAGRSRPYRGRADHRPHGGDARTLAVAQAVEDEISGFVPTAVGAVVGGDPATADRSSPFLGE